MLWLPLLLLYFLNHFKTTPHDFLADTWVAHRSAQPTRLGLAWRQWNDWVSTTLRRDIRSFFRR
jgi:hypothetical protein